MNSRYLKLVAIPAIISLTLGLGACSASLNEGKFSLDIDTEQLGQIAGDTLSSAQDLVKKSVKYLGSNSEVKSLVDQVISKNTGIELNTKKEPYGIKINLPAGVSLDSADLQARATQLIALIGNLDSVTFSNGEKDFTTNTQELNSLLETDVKSLKSDPKKLSESIDKLLGSK